MKAVLVLGHMPNGCVECPLARTVYGEMMCVATERETNYVIDVDKPGSCPLKELSGRIDDWDAYGKGWNDCLREIEGSEEDEAANSKD